MTSRRVSARELFFFFSGRKVGGLQSQHFWAEVTRPTRSRVGPTRFFFFTFTYFFKILFASSDLLFVVCLKLKNVFF